MHADPIEPRERDEYAGQHAGSMIDQSAKTAGPPPTVTLEGYLDEHERMLDVALERIDTIVARLDERLAPALSADVPREGPFGVVGGTDDKPDLADLRSALCQRVDSSTVQTHARLALIFHRLNVLADRIEV